MRSLILAFVLASTAASAQLPLPTNLPLTDTKTGEVIGTATLWGNRMVLRRKNGEFIATAVFDRDGTRTLYDEHGKVLDQINVPIPELPK